LGIILSANDAGSCQLFPSIGHHPNRASVMLSLWGVYLYVYTLSVAEINAFTPANLDAFTLSVFDADNKLLPPPARMHVHDTLHVADIMPTLFSVCPSLMLFWLDEFPRRSLTLMATDCRNR
jgi:hypothetical protein